MFNLKQKNKVRKFKNSIGPLKQYNSSELKKFFGDMSDKMVRTETSLKDEYFDTIPGTERVCWKLGYPIIHGISNYYHSFKPKVFLSYNPNEAKYNACIEFIDTTQAYYNSTIENVTSFDELYECRVSFKVRNKDQYNTPVQVKLSNKKILENRIIKFDIEHDDLKNYIKEIAKSGPQELWHGTYILNILVDMVNLKNNRNYFSIKLPNMYFEMNDFPDKNYHPLLMRLICKPKKQGI